MPRRFVIASGLSVAAIFGHYDVVVGDYVGDRIVVACLLVLPFLAWRNDE